MPGKSRSSAVVAAPGSASTSRWLVITTAAAFLMVLTAVTVEEIHNDRIQAVAAAVRQNQNKVDGFYRYVMRTLDLANAQLSAAASSKVVQRALTEESGRRSVVVPFVSVAPGFVALTLQRPAALGPGPGSWPALPTAQLAAGGGGDRLAISQPVRGPANQKFLGITKLFRMARGRGYYLTLWVQPRVFTDFAESIPFYPTDLISLIGLDGISRVRRTGNVTTSGEDLRGTLVMARQTSAPNGTYYGPSSIDGLPRIFSHRRIPGESLFVTSGVSLSTALAQHQHRIAIYLTYLATEAFFLLLAMGFILRGISDRHRQISVLRHAADRLNEAQYVGKMGSWDYDFATGQLIWSDNLNAMYQRPGDQPITGLDAIAPFVGAIDLERIQNALDSVRQRGEPVEYELTVTLPDGTRSIRKILAVPTRDSNGAISGVHGTDQDISSSKAVEILEAKLANLAQTDAMNAIASTLAHELNQPLSAIANYSSAAVHLLAQGDSAVPAARDLIAKAIQQVHLSADIIHGARDLVRGEKADIQSASLARILDDCLTVLKSEEHFEPDWITLKLEPSADPVLAKPAQITQVFLNLIRNSLEAIPEGRTPKIFIGSDTDNGPYCTIEVRDNGVGLADFTGSPFSALTSSKGGGLGIGLSLCRTIIEAHGGRIWIAATSARGSSIQFTLRRGTH